MNSLAESAELENSEFGAFLISDTTALYALDRCCLLSPWSYEGFSNELCHSYSHCWGRRNNLNTPDAFVLSHVVLDEAHLLKIGVAPEIRGQGVGKRLMVYCLRRYESLGVSYVYLEVRRSNFVARNFYKGLGFTETGERIDYYSKEDGFAQESEDAILYSKTI